MQHLPQRLEGSQLLREAHSTLLLTANFFVEIIHYCDMTTALWSHGGSAVANAH